MFWHLVVRYGVEELRNVVSVSNGSRNGVRRQQGVFRHNRIHVVDELKVILEWERSTCKEISCSLGEVGNKMEL